MFHVSKATRGSAQSADVRPQELPHPRQRFGRLGPGRAWGLIGLAGGETSRWGWFLGDGRTMGFLMIFVEFDDLAIEN